MKVTLVTSTPEVHISECAKVCYATRSIDDGGRDITKQLVEGNGHLAVLRFAFAIVKVEGISIAAQNQFVRSKHLDFLVESKRYVSADKGNFKFIMPDALEGEFPDVMQEHFDNTLELYKKLVSRGVKKEDARAILPMNTSTNMFVSGNLQAWHDMFKLRLTPHAQSEIRAIAANIYTLLQAEYPQVFTPELYLKFKEGDK